MTGNHSLLFVSWLVPPNWNCRLLGRWLVAPVSVDERAARAGVGDVVVEREAVGVELLHVVDEPDVGVEVVDVELLAAGQAGRDLGSGRDTTATGSGTALKS